MSSKQLTGNGQGTRSPATGTNPADFPLGSPQSRAAARAMIERMNYLSPDDEDALMLLHLLTGRTLGQEQFRASAVYKRGLELSERRDDSTCLGVDRDRWTIASICFRICFGREPVAGDVLRHGDVELAFCPAIREADLRQHEEAWTRQLPNLLFPFKFEDGKVYALEYKDRHTETEWVECFTGSLFFRTAEQWWRTIVDEALYGRGPRPNRHELIAGKYIEVEEPITISAVTFAGIKDRKHALRPSTDDEMRQARPEPTGGILGAIAELQRTSEGQ